MLDGNSRILKWSYLPYMFGPWFRDIPPISMAKHMVLTYLHLEVSWKRGTPTKPCAHRLKAALDSLAAHLERGACAACVYLIYLPREENPIAKKTSHGRGRRQIPNKNLQLFGGSGPYINAKVAIINMMKITWHKPICAAANFHACVNPRVSDWFLLVPSLLTRLLSAISWWSNTHHLPSPEPESWK